MSNIISYPFSPFLINTCIFLFSITGRSFETGAARTFSSHEDHRHSILRTVESYLERMGGFHDGHACILRAICEVRQ